MKALITALSALSLFLACLVVSSAEAQEPDKAAPTDYKVADVVPGAISPDGRLLSYTDWSTGDLALQDLKTGEKRRLTNKGSWLESSEFAEVAQAISRDGKQVAYAWHIERGCDLRIIGLDGSQPRVIYRNEEIRCIQVQDWSPEGKHILATFSKKDGTSQTVLVSVADGSVRVLPTMGPSSLLSTNMAFSPDGRWIVYDFPPREEFSERDIYLLSTDGSRGFSLVEHPANDFVLGWAPDGERVLFASDRAGTFGAWVIRVVDGQPRGAPELVKPDIAPIANTWLGLTRDGSYYYGYTAWVSDVYVATLDPATGTLQPPQKLVSHVGHDTSVEWSPDGQYLAYASGRGRGLDPFVLGIRSIRTGEEQRRRLGMKIRRKGGHAFQLHWSPDGRSLLAQGRDELGDGFFRIDAHTGEVTPIVVQTETVIEWPVWSSDGKAIFYRWADMKTGSQSLVVRDLETGRERELYRGNPDRPAGENEQSTVPAQPTEMDHGGYVGASNLAVSPDGQQLAFVWSDFDEQGPTSRALKVIPTTAGGETRELLRVQSPERLFQPAWMPDGGHVLFGKGRLQGQEPTLEIWRISAEGGEPQYLGLALEGLLLYGLSVHPDGQRIAFTAGRTLGDQTWLM
ncbi:MAG: hypothetical protein O7D93_02155, partial [Acidobacteria bacterium]|nr:hypothetical protein [Acidobacteriota bacterium]